MMKIECCFQYLAIIKNTAMNIVKLVSLSRVKHPLGIFPRVVIGLFEVLIYAIEHITLVCVIYQENSISFRLSNLMEYIFLKCVFMIIWIPLLTVVCLPNL